MKEFKPDVCQCCGMTTNYLLPLDRGSAMILLDLLKAIDKKGKNEIHPTRELEFLGVKKWYPSNMSRPRKHGLIAFVKGKKGYYAITRKGGEFLRGKAIPKYAVISKKDECTAGYYDPQGFTVGFRQLLKDDEIPFWEGEFAAMAKRGVFTEIENSQLTLDLTSN